jgi:hypothetical protein
MTELTTFERFLLLSAVEYYLLNKKADPFAGQVPYIDDMSGLRNMLTDRKVHLYKKTYALDNLLG